MTDLFGARVCQCCGQPLPTEEPDEFARWWAAYPHKIGKGQAQRAWKTARKLAPFQMLMDGLDTYKSTNPGFWCNPATWLNGQRWLDRPAPSEVGIAVARSGLDIPGKAEEIVKQWIDNGRKGFWPQSYGPEPGEPGMDPRIRQAWDRLQIYPSGNKGSDCHDARNVQKR